jgi:hypothetical protein
MQIQTPECDKMLAVKDKSQVIGEFIEWLESKKELSLCRYEDSEFGDGVYFPYYMGTEELLAEFFGIDLDKAEKEKKEILKALRSKNKKGKND